MFDLSTKNLIVALMRKFKTLAAHKWLLELSFINSKTVKFL
jgi:hypothetical protein